MNRLIIHVDMDAFFAAVETRDNPMLVGKPLIIGALPHERGVVSTCNYEARTYGVHSAMNIKEAYRRCPNGLYMHPNIEKYKTVTKQIHKIWADYTDIVEYLSLDEGYLDVTGSLQKFGGALSIAKQIKQRTKEETGLTCSVGIGYSMASAKLASEEKKPDGLFELTTPDDYQKLILNRSARVIPGVGTKTAEKLHFSGINTVQDILNHPEKLCALLGKHGQQIVQMANGIDNRTVTPWYEEEQKSIGHEQTFQKDTTDISYLKNMLLLIAKKLSLKLRSAELYSQTITLKVTYGNMKQITRGKTREATNQADIIYETTVSLLEKIEKRPIRLIGISLSGLTDEAFHQLSLEDIKKEEKLAYAETLDEKVFSLQKKYGGGIIKTGRELQAEKLIYSKNDSQNTRDNPSK